MNDIWDVHFILKEPSSFNASTEIDGVKVELFKNRREIHISNLLSNGQELAITTARSYGNIFLDTLSWKHDRNLEITYPTRAIHATLSGHEEVSEIESPIIYGGTIEIQIMDSNGKIVGDSTELGVLKIERSDAASFYRRACLSSDLFDRFRNYYLAAENIADRIRLKKGLGRSDLKKLFNSPSYEQNLLQLGLKESFEARIQALVENVKKICTLNDKEPVLQQIANILYVGYRCQLDHAKATEDKKIPFNSQNEEEVKSVIPLMEFVAKSLLSYEETALNT